MQTGPLTAELASLCAHLQRRIACRQPHRIAHMRAFLRALENTRDQAEALEDFQALRHGKIVILSPAMALFDGGAS